MTYHETDRTWMRRALDLAARGRVSPNPMVGAVIVQNGTVVGEGYHQVVGEAHAEVLAIQDAGDKAEGATMYVTLEPCCHFGRTPPCTEKTIAAGIKRVVVAMEDPDARVAGQGIATLRNGGIIVDTGILEKEAHRLNAAYIHHRRTGLPFVILKLAQTLDGRVATTTGHSHWITGPEARTRAHQIRSESDGILVGIGTVLADDPQLTVRHVEGRQPRRIVLDSTARTPLSARLLNTGKMPPLICVTEEAPQERIDALQATGAEILILPSTTNHRIDPMALLQHLGKQLLMTLMVEGGSQIATAFLKEKAVQQIMCFIAPKLTGTGISAIGDLGIETMDAAIILKDTTLEQVGDDILVTGFPDYPD